MFSTENIGEEQKNSLNRMLISESSAAALPSTRFRGLARVPEIRASVPSSARVPGVAMA